MVNPVPRSVECQWVVFYGPFVNIVTEIEQDAEGSSGDNGVGRMGKDVVAREGLSHVGKARRHQELFHRKM